MLLLAPPFSLPILLGEPALNGVRDETAHNRIGPACHAAAHTIDAVRRIVDNLLDRVGRGPRHIVGGRDDLADGFVQIGEDSAGGPPCSSSCHF